MKRGDLTEDGYIYNGSKQMKLRNGRDIPEEFQVPTEFPPNYWEDYSKNLRFWFDATPFMDQLIDNTKVKFIEEDPETIYIISHFVYDEIDYTVICYVPDIDLDFVLNKGNLLTQEYIYRNLRNIYASTMYSHHNRYLDESVDYPKNKTLFITHHNKYPKAEDYVLKLKKFARGNNYEGYYRVALNIDIYDIDEEYLEGLFKDPKSSESEIRFWIKFPYLNLQLSTVLLLPLNHDYLFYEALEKVDMGMISDTDMDNMKELSKRDKKFADRYNTVIRDPRFPEELED